MNVRKYSYYAASLGKLAAEVRPLGQVARLFLGNAPDSGPLCIELPHAGVRFKVRGAMDVWTVKETFLDRFYERFGTPVGRGWTVVDVGGGIGDFTILAAQAHPSNRVFAFEPTPDSFALLQENLHLNHATNAQAFAEAIWSQDGSISLDTSAVEPGQYTSQRVEAAAGGPARQVIVPSVSLHTAFERLGLEHCDLLKLDCEGAEYPILFNAPAAVLGKVQRIVMEYHDNVSHYTHTDMQGFLESQGYRVQVTPNYVHAHLGYLFAWRDEV